MSGDEALIDLAAASPAAERERLKAVRRYDILDSPPEGTFDRIADIAARTFGAPIAVVSVVDADRIWFKSHRGLDTEEIDRVPGLCASAMLRDGPTLIPDASLDPEAMSNPLVVGETAVRFYAAAPLRTTDGQGLGTLCVLDSEAHHPGPEEMATLADLAGVVMDELELRLATRQALEYESDLRKLETAHQLEAQQLGESLLATLVPPRLPMIPGLETAALYRPANLSQVGGDFYDMFPVGDGDWGVAIGDVSGKGAGAATIAAAARHALRGAAVDHRDAGDVLAAVNEALLMDAEDGLESLLATAVYARLHPYRGGFRLRVACAGHPAPLVLRRSGRVEELETGGRLLGFSAEPPCSESHAHLSLGDAVVFFTDGVSEAPDGLELFGIEGIATTFDASERVSAQDLIDAIDTALTTGSDYQRDDVAVVAIKVTGRSGRPEVTAS